MPGYRADCIIVDDLDAETPPEGRQDAARWWHFTDDKTIEDCKAKFERLWPTPFVGLDRPRTVEEFNRLYLTRFEPDPEDDGDQDTRL